MGKGLVKDAESMATAAKIYDILSGCEKVLAEHSKRASQDIYGHGIWAAALEHDLVSVRARLQRVHALISGSCPNLPKQQI